ncbi:DUF4190 domain-containing protein [Leptobacterium flavescens]|uniref:DUF4190 domain-containing protein n=1 Tax=Leptobacterium flavescens TaxID=472055 RepID=A0A6P0UUU9_9FLAO|nr:CCC motif membrane protein [Leptobacterium flavescens]NER14186.1 DUF4190 domain-containing protein [Leptobacterium flavescens]
MEQQKLPNSTLILVLGISSIILCCCWGIGGLASAIALILAAKATKLYKENPDMYSDYKNVKTGKILAIIGIVFFVIYIATVIYIRVVIGADEFREMMEEFIEQNQ